MGLTDKQEIFIQQLLKGKSQREAYRTAYPTSRKWKDDSVDCEASKLFHSTKVSQRYQELKKEIEEEHKKKNLWNKEKALTGLLWLMQKAQNDINDKGIRQANSTAFLNALKEINELEGLGAERELKIKKLENELVGNENSENKLASYFEMLAEAVREDD